MKILFIFPFINTKGGDPIKFLPIGPAALIGTLKPDFPEIIFEQIELEEEIREKKRQGKIDKKYEKLLESFNQNKALFPSSNAVKEYKGFFDKLINFFQIDQYDHYFFSRYDDDCGLRANLFFAKYLKSLFPDKKIIFGGINNARSNEIDNSLFNSLNFIDSFIVGPGEKSMRLILQKLLDSEKLDTKYSFWVSPQEKIKNLPDYKSNRSLSLFKHSVKELEGKEGGSKNLISIPYYFSIGCFWSQCAYCANSHFKGSSPSQKQAHKSIDQIISDLTRLKKDYKTKHFIFFNQNFNFDLDFTKQLLKRIISEKLDILWTDYFNLTIFDEELPSLLTQAGCYRIDLGTVTFNDKLQKLYSNLFKNQQLKYLKYISDAGIWINLNIIANLPYSYSIEGEKKVLKNYLKYFDSADINFYRNFSISDLALNYRFYDLKTADKKIVFKEGLTGNLSFIEKNGGKSVDEKAVISQKNYLDWERFLIKNGKVINNHNFAYLSYLYDAHGFNNKERIKKLFCSAKNNTCLLPKESKDKVGPKGRLSLVKKP
ncbi:MAG TPA: radical SAM protein [Candidatus Portnoybacteria bacterium]|nr:radical SAM protein [Candidatus Portnoybacteria bacterium]